jgi:hypothetical protein
VGGEGVRGGFRREAEGQRDIGEGEGTKSRRQGGSWTPNITSGLLKKKKNFELDNPHPFFLGLPKIHVTCLSFRKYFFGVAT